MRCGGDFGEWKWRAGGAGGFFSPGKRILGNGSGGRSERGDFVHAECGFEVCSGIKYETADDGAGAGQVGKGLPVSDDGGDKRDALEEWDAARGFDSGGARRSQFVEPEISV